MVRRKDVACGVKEEEADQQHDSRVTEMEQDDEEDEEERADSRQAHDCDSFLWTADPHKAHGQLDTDLLVLLAVHH